jgi:methionyl aminopeptidase
MVYLKTEEEIALIRESALIVGGALAEVAKILEPGITGLAIDKRAEEFICDHGGKPGFKGYNKFPNTLCISVNEQVVHGIPSKVAFKEGDVVSVDCGVLKNGFYGDSAYTFPIGIVSDQVLKLLKVTKESLYKGIYEATAGKRIGDIGNAVQSHAEAHGFSVVRELVGHGLGKSLHESPEVPNYGRRGNGYLLKEGMVLAIEPMINLGKKEVVQDSDGWTIRTADRKFSAHFEHDVVVRSGKAEILSTFDLIEEVLTKQNIIY